MVEYLCHCVTVEKVAQLPLAESPNRCNTKDMEKGVLGLLHFIFTQTDEKLPSSS